MKNLKGCIKEKEINGGVQYLFKFENGYGASVVKHDFSYGGKKGLWELAVIKIESVDKWQLCYTTEITNDVLGWLSNEDVIETLNKIETI